MTGAAAVPWLWPLLSLVIGIIGGWIGAWMGIHVKLAVFEHRLVTAEATIESLRKDRHTHANVIQGHEYRLHTIERWKEKEE